jgi:broad-specificity NMP kinase
MSLQCDIKPILGEHMKLIYIYGPPGVGKLTVATALSKLTGFKVFHNHVTLNTVETVFDWGTKPFWEYVTKYRLELIEAAAREQIPGLIFTFVYGKDVDDWFVKDVVDAVERHGGEVCFVQLACALPELKRRLKDISRKPHRKLRKVTSLRNIMKQYDITSGVPYETNLCIDTTKLSAQKTAVLIVEQYGLKPASD